MSSNIFDVRSKNYVKQLKGSVFFKIFALLLSFIAVPVTIDYLGKVQYGVWSTLLSILSWVLVFDLGVGNGLRNRVSESVANEDFSAAREYITSAYVAVGLGALFIGILCVYISNFVPWTSVFNTSLFTNEKLKFVVNISIIFVLINFNFSLINQILNALQKTELTVFNQFLANLFSLTFVYVLYIFTESSILYLAFFYGFSIFLANMVVSIWFYKSTPYLFPRFNSLRKKKLKPFCR